MKQKKNRAGRSKRPWWGITVIGVVLLATAAFVILNRSTHKEISSEARFILTYDSLEVVTREGSQPLLTVNDLEDTVPDIFPHSRNTRFLNKKFHFLAVSPNQQKFAFALGEGDQWLGMYDAADKFERFLAFGIQTTFLTAVWSPDSKHLAYAFHSPDGRLMTYIMQPPDAYSFKPKNLNVWFMNADSGETVRPRGWIEPGDTVYSFDVVDISGELKERVNLNLHFNLDLVPEQMKKSAEKDK